MSEPTTGSYPQLAGSFYNAAAMMPHSGGRVAPQIPTPQDSGGLLQAIQMRMSRPDIPNSANILTSRSANIDSYYRANDQTVATAGKVLFGASMLTGVSSLIGATSMAGKILGGPVLGTGLMLASSALEKYNKEREEVRTVQKALSGLNLTGNSMADPLTGSLNLGASLQIKNTLQSKLGGFSSDELKGVMEYAAKTGGLIGHTGNAKQLTDRVMQLAKVTKEIVDISEGITAADAANMQQMLSGMGISTNKMLKSNIGKKLVTAGKTAGLTLEEMGTIAQVSAQGYTQMGLSAAQGVLSGAYTTQAAHVIAGSGTLTEEQMMELGGREGIQQSLFKAGAAGMSNSMNKLVMGSVKLGRNGKFMIDTDMLDMAVSGKISSKELESRASENMKSINSMDSRSRNLLLSELTRAMPELSKKVSEEITPAQQMNLAAAGIKELMGKGLDVKSSMDQYFGGDKQAIQAFTEYAKTLPQIMQEQRRQNFLAKQDKLLKKSSEGISVVDNNNLAARLIGNIGKSYDAVVEAIFDPTGRAERALIQQENSKYRNLGFINGINNTSILGSYLRDSGISSRPYALSMDDVMSPEFSRGITTKALQGPSASDLMTSKSLEASLGFNRPVSLEEYYTDKDYAANMRAAAKRDFNRRTQKGANNTRYNAEFLNYNEDIVELQDGNFMAKRGYGENQETVILDKEGNVLHMTGNNMAVDPRQYLNIASSAIDTNDPGDWMYEDTDSIAGIGYGDKYMELYKGLTGDLGSNWFTEGLNKLTRPLTGNGVYSNYDEKEAISTIANAGLTYKKLFMDNDRGIRVAKRGLRDRMAEDTKRTSLAGSYDRLLGKISSKLSDTQDSYWDSSNGYTGLYIDQLEQLINETPGFENLSKDERTALLQEAMDDIRSKGTDKTKIALARFEEITQQGAGVTNLYMKDPTAMDLSNVTNIFGSDLSGFRKSFAKTKTQQSAMADTLAAVSKTIVKAKDAAGLKAYIGLNRDELSRKLGVQRLTEEQYDYISSILSKASSAYSSGNKEDIQNLFGLLEKGDSNTLPTILTDLETLDKQQQFIEETRKQNNDLSSAISTAYDEAKNPAERMKSAMGAGASLLGKRDISSLLGADFSKLTQGQQGELLRMQVSAKSLKGTEQKKALEDLVVRAQQYANQSGGTQGPGGSLTGPAMMKEISTALTELNKVMQVIHGAMDKTKPIYVRNADS